MHSLLRSPLLTLLALVVGASASAQAPPARGFDVSDLSVLYPLPKNEAQRASLLSLEAKDSNGADFISEAVFQSLRATSLTPKAKKVEVFAIPGTSLGEVKGPGIKFAAGMELRRNWRVVSFRFDPCAPMPVAGRRCAVQLRLVAQPILGGKDVDATIHLVYNLNDPNAAIDEAPEIARRVARDLHGLVTPETAGRALGVHPVLKREGLGGPATLAFNRFLERTIATAKSRLLAIMGLERVGSEPWVFVAGFAVGNSFLPVAQKFGDQIRASQAITPSKLKPALPEGRISTAKLVAMRSADSLTADDASVIATIDNPTLSGLLPFEQDSAAHRDCASCHSATSALLRITGDGGQAAEIARFVASTNRSSAPPGVTAYPAASALRTRPWSVRNFGYFDGKPAVTLRTVNETARAVVRANELLALPPPSSLRCEEPKVWACILDRSAGKKTRECLNKFCSEAP